VLADQRGRPVQRRNSEPQFRSSSPPSLTVSSLSSLPFDSERAAANWRSFRSSLDPNVAPFSPRPNSPRPNSPPTTLNSNNKKLGVERNNSSDSGCHSDKDDGVTTSQAAMGALKLLTSRSVVNSGRGLLGSPPGLPKEDRAGLLDIWSLVESKMRTEVEKFEEDSRSPSVGPDLRSGAKEKPVDQSTVGQQPVEQQPTSSQGGSSSGSSTLSSYRSAATGSSGSEDVEGSSNGLGTGRGLSVGRSGPSRPLMPGVRPKRTDRPEDDDSVFLPSKGLVPPPFPRHSAPPRSLPVPAMITVNRPAVSKLIAPRAASAVVPNRFGLPLPIPRHPSTIHPSGGSGLLPTPDDFPPFGPLINKAPTRPPVMRAPIAMPPPVAVDLNNNQLQGEKDIIAKDPYGLRALVAALATQPNSQNLEQKSHFSFAELGFPSEFRENYFPKRHFFGSPFDNKLVNVMTDEYVKEIPADYRLSDASSRKLPEPNFRQFSSDLLFFMFYTANQDQWQIEASRELFRRGWRFLISRKIWLGCLNVAQTFRTQTSERGRYQFFNPTTWSRDFIELTIFYDDVAGLDVLPGPSVPPPQGPSLLGPALLPTPSLPSSVTYHPMVNAPPPPLNQPPPSLSAPPPPYAMMMYQQQRQQHQLQLATTAKIRAAAAAAVQAEQEMIQLQQHQQRLFIHQQASQHQNRQPTPSINPTSLLGNPPPPFSFNIGNNLPVGGHFNQDRGFVRFSY